MSTIKAWVLVLALITLTLAALVLRTTDSLGRKEEQVAMALATTVPAPTVGSTPTAPAPLPFPPTPLPEMGTGAEPVLVSLPSAPVTPTYIVLSNAAPPAPTAKPAKGAAARRQPTDRAPRNEPQAKAVVPRRTLDPRLPRQVSIHEAQAAAGQAYWFLASVRWLPPAEAGGLHHIFVEVVDEHGRRLSGQMVQVSWPGGSIRVPTDGGKPEGESVSFPQYGLLGSYNVVVLGLPSDEIRGLGLGLPDNAGWADHTCWYLLFQRSRKTP